VALYFCKGEEITKELNAFLLRHLSELVEDGHAPSNFSINLLNKRIIYAKINNEIAGHILWEWQPGWIAYIIFTVIDKKYEKRGLYTIMHRVYENRIKEGGALCSKSQLHSENNRIIELSKENGYDIEYYRMIKKF
jgi:hypothetical protein